jgi:hypothetical protein
VATVELDLATAGGGGNLLARHGNPLRGLLAIWMALLMLVIGGVFIGGRRTSRRKLALFGLGGLLLLLLLVGGCGGLPGSVATPPGTYNFTVNATSGAIQHPVIVTVQVVQ